MVRCNDEALEMYIATIPSDMSRDDLVIQFAALQRIQAESVWSDSKGVAESYWNSRVHDRMLEQAFDFSPGFKVHDIKSARILTELESLNPYGQTLKNRMVDYGITVGAPTISEKEVRACLRNSTGPPCDTVNPIDYEAARHEPFPIIIETKSDQGSEKEAVVQVSGWAIAYFDRLKTLSRGPVDITLPLIVIMGTSWKLFFACNLDDEIHIIKATHIGDTDKLVGCYKILKILKLLAEWVQTTFVNWYRDNVLPAH